MHHRWRRWVGRCRRVDSLEAPSILVEKTVSTRTSEAPVSKSSSCCRELEDSTSPVVQDPSLQISSLESNLEPSLDAATLKGVPSLDLSSMVSRVLQEEESSTPPTPKRPKMHKPLWNSSYIVPSPRSGRLEPCTSLINSHRTTAQDALGVGYFFASPEVTSQPGNVSLLITREECRRAVGRVGLPECFKPPRPCPGSIIPREAAAEMREEYRTMLRLFSAEMVAGVIFPQITQQKQILHLLCRVDPTLQLFQIVLTSGNVLEFSFLRLKHVSVIERALPVKDDIPTTVYFVVPNFDGKKVAIVTECVTTALRIRTCLMLMNKVSKSRAVPSCMPQFDHASTDLSDSSLSTYEDGVDNWLVRHCFGRGDSIPPPCPGPVRGVAAFCLGYDR